MKLESNHPQFPKKLPGSFWGLTTFFNPLKYKNKLENYKVFRKFSKKQGLKLLTVELAFGDGDFELKKKDADILIQIRVSKKNILWQKEALLNIGLKNLPRDCDKIAWIDSDIIFKNNNWVKEASKLLEKYAVLQLFSICIRLNKKNSSLLISNLPYKLKGSKRFGAVYTKVHFGDYSPLSYRAHPGFAWAARKNIFDKCSFYDASIICHGDSIMFDSFYFPDDKSRFFQNLSRLFSDQMIVHQRKWRKKVYPLVKRSVFYIPGTILHLWHGSIRNRNYWFRHALFKKYSFCPTTDIKKDKNGVWTWASNKKKLHRRIKRYFVFRNEEGSILINLLNFPKNTCLQIRKVGIMILGNARFVYKIYKIKCRKYYNNIKNLLGNISFYIINTPDRLLGKFGIFLKKHNAGLYHKLKRIEKKIRK